MTTVQFSVGGILSIIFRHIHESPRTLAEYYVYRDRTLVYKWLHGTATPSKALVAGIVRFVMEKSCEPVRLSMRHELEVYIGAAGLRPEIAAQLIQTEPFQKFMEDVLSLAISIPSGDRALAGTTGSDHPRSRSLQVSELVRALLAVFAGGIFWNGINHALGWAFFMGGDGREPRGIAAAIWGLSVIVPIVCASGAAHPLRRAHDQSIDWPNTVIVPMLHILAGVMGALVFYDSGVRRVIAQLHLAYGPQELVTGMAFAMIISVLPLGVSIATVRRAGTSRSGAMAELGYAFLPTLLVAAAVSLTLFIDRPVTELEQLRGFVVGLMLRIGMYIVARRHVLAAAIACGDERGRLLNST